MRPLRFAAGDRPAPIVHARPRPDRQPAAPRRRSTARRRPAPLWLRPVAVSAAVTLAIAMLGGGAWWLWHSGRIATALAAGQHGIAEVMALGGLTVQQVNVQGRHETAPEQILAAVGVQRGDPILFFDAEAARQRLERIGWVKKASVQRLLPDTILLRLIERRPFARWQIDGKTVLIDRDGTVLSQGDPADFRDLRRVVGAGAADHAGALFDMLMAEPRLFARVRSAVRVRDRRWDIELDDGVTIKLPEENAETAWRHLALLDQEQKLLSKGLVAIDLRLPDRLVVKLSPTAAKRMAGRET